MSGMLMQSTNFTPIYIQRILTTEYLNSLLERPCKIIYIRVFFSSFKLEFISEL